MGLLSGKVALITGAARGIGKAIALKYASEGAAIAFTDLEINETARQTIAELEAFGVAVKDEFIKLIPLKRGSTVEEVANVALFLGSDLSSYVTGQVIAVNGGMYC